MQAIRTATPSVFRPSGRRAQGLQPTFIPSLTDVPIYNVSAYGNANTCSGPSNDDGPAFQGAINAAESSNGPAIVLIPYQHCYIQETLNVTASNIHVRGISNGVNNNPGTEITWSSSCGFGTGPLFNFAPSGNTAIESSDLSDVYLDGGGGAPARQPCAGKAVIISSVQHGQWSNISGDTFSQVFIECTVNESLSGQGGSIRNVFNDINVWMYYPGNSGVGIFFTTPSNGNFDCNQNIVQNSYFGTYNGYGAMFWTADHNVMFNDQFYWINTVGGLGGGVKFSCGANYNIGYNGDPDTIVSNGTTACGSGSQAKHNRWVDLPSYPDPSASVPLTQPGATFSWTNNTGGTFIENP